MIIGMSVVVALVSAIGSLILLAASMARTLRTERHHRSVE